MCFYAKYVTSSIYTSKIKSKIAESAAPGLPSGQTARLVAPHGSVFFPIIDKAIRKGSSPTPGDWMTYLKRLRETPFGGRHDYLRNRITQVFQIFDEAKDSKHMYIDGAPGSDTLLSHADGGEDFMWQLKVLFYNRGFLVVQIEDYYFDTETWTFVRKEKVDGAGAGAGGNKRGGFDFEEEQELSASPLNSVGDDDDDNNEGAAASANKKRRKELRERLQ